MNAPLRVAVSLVAAAAVVAAAVAPAPAAVPEVSASFCGSSAYARNLLVALERRGVTASALIGRMVRMVQDDGATTTLVLADGTTVAAPAEPPRAIVCTSYREDTVLLASAASLAGSTLAEIAAALRFRETHPWPTAKPAHPGDPGTSVYVTVRGPFAYVSFYDDPRRLNEFDGCGGQEYYRVDPSTLAVEAFNGCLVGGATVPLPRIDRIDAAGALPP